MTNVRSELSAPSPIVTSVATDDARVVAVAHRPRIGLFRYSRGLTELVLIGFLYVVYCLSRTIASSAFAPAHERAAKLLDFEKVIGIAWETTVNKWFALDHALAVFGSYWYATTHYLVTAGVLIWLYRQGPRKYLPARRALVLATVLGLTAYLLIPTAPPRLFGGYVDILRLTSADGWWGGDASAPKGLGGLTNQLAAFPSLHSGWALWVAIVLWQHATIKALRYLGWLYAATTAFVIVGTGNHWVIDSISGWLVVIVGFLLVRHLPSEPIGLWPKLRAARAAGVPDTPETADVTVDA